MILRIAVSESGGVEGLIPDVRCIEKCWIQRIAVSEKEWSWRVDGIELGRRHAGDMTARQFVLSSLLFSSSTITFYHLLLGHNCQHLLLPGSRNSGSGSPTLTPVQFIETTAILSPPPLFMPVSRSVYKRCVCEECIETGDWADDGTPKGVLIVERLMAAHLQCTRRTQVECAALAHAAVNDDADLMASQLRALTLTDNEPPVASHVHPEHPNPTPPVHFGHPILDTS
ncbi:hypothetical protein C8R48DRAFT_677157 [Suillus tomentosus]|nr:hypothetical protein C8R48DRAFT_677157 [Suillus tomentosus]